MKITGQCHCGAISFTALVDPNRVLSAVKKLFLQVSMNSIA